MAVSYKRLFKLLIDRDLKKKELCRMAKVSPATLAKMANGDNVMVGVLEKICLTLHCNIEDVVEIIPDENLTDTASSQAE